MSDERPCCPSCGSHALISVMGTGGHMLDCECCYWRGLAREAKHPSATGNDSPDYRDGYADGHRDAIEQVRFVSLLAEVHTGEPQGMEPSLDAQPECPLCGGTKMLRWGRPGKMGGEDGPCLCTPSGREKLQRNRTLTRRGIMRAR